MARIKITGNEDIDQATATLAVALRHEHPGWLDQEVYNAAMNLRDAIMAGTRNLDELRRFGTTVPGYHHPEPADAQHPLARADQGVHPHPQPVKQFPAPTYGQRQPMGDDDAEDPDRYDREAREEFKRTGAAHTHVATSGNRVTRPGSMCPGATCYALAVNEINDEAALASDGSFDYRDARGAVPRAEGTPRAEDVIREGR